MKKTLMACALALAATCAHAQDGLSLGVGVDYSTGDYGTETTTRILSVPLSAKLVSGDWTFKASLPWMRVEGDPNVVPGLGSIVNLNPIGRGRGRGDTGTGTAESGTASGIGDLRLAATYTLPSTGALGVDLTANAKIATADEDKGLGTGANDYGVAVDLYRDFSGTTLFGGVGYTWLGESDYIDVDAVANANVGASWKTGVGSVGLMYDWREAATAEAEERSEVTGFFSLPAGETNRVQLYATKGLSDGSPDWGAGVSFTAGF
ncbi:MAG: transporter [Pseudomonadota bacterium]